MARCFQVSRECAGGLRTSLRNAPKTSGKACSFAVRGLYPRHPHRVRRTNRIKRVGRTPALFFWAGPPTQISGTGIYVSDLLRRIEDIVQPTITGMGYDLVRVAISKGGTLQIMVEPADGRPMDVEDCATLSRALSAVLDVEDPITGTYTLEVS